MQRKTAQRLTAAVLLIEELLRLNLDDPCGRVLSCGSGFHPNTPKTWDDKPVEALELPLAQPDRPPRYLTAEQCYKLKVQPIYRAYPAYAKGRPPLGYLDSLKKKEPEIIFDVSKLRIKEDWIAARL